MHITEFQGYINKAFGFAKSTRYRFEITIGNLLSQSYAGQNDPLRKSHNNFFEALGISNARLADRLAFFCDSVSLPSKGWLPTFNKIYGPFVTMPGLVMYQPVAASFYMGRDMLEKKFFDAWMYAIENPESHDHNFYNEYTTDIYVYQLDDLAAIPPLPGVAGKAQRALNTGLEYAQNVVPYIPGAQRVFSTIANFQQNPFSSAKSGVLGKLNDFFGARYTAKLVHAWPFAVETVPLAFGNLDQIPRLQVSFAFEYWINPLVNKANFNPKTTGKTVTVNPPEYVHSPIPEELDIPEIEDETRGS